MQERHGKEIKIGVIVDMRFGSDFWSEIRQKGYQNESQIEENPTKNGVQKTTHFLTPKNRCGGICNRIGGA